MVKLTKDYYIGADTYNWILYERKKSKKTGKESFYAWKFYPTLEALIKAVLNFKLRGLESQENDLKALTIRMSAEQEKFLKDVHTTCEGIKKEWVEVTNDKKKI